MSTYLRLALSNDFGRVILSNDLRLFLFIYFLDAGLIENR